MIIKSTGRQLVIGDIHGYANTLMRLIDQVGLHKSDQLFLLGDYISRGPHSAQVLDYVMRLQHEGFQIYPLRGNHEQMALDSHANRLKEPTLLKSRVKRGLMDESGLLLPVYHDWMERLPFFYELETAFLAHAGLNFEAEDPLTDPHAMIWQKSFEYNAQKVGGKHVIYGHVTRTLATIQQDVASKKMAIGIDGGSYKLREEGKGYICCLDLTNWLLLWESCREEMQEGASA